MALALGLCLGGCKVPISDVAASFRIADTVWFAEEETLFVFYEVSAEQGLGEETVLEIRYSSDDGPMPWTELATLSMVHTHLFVDCGLEGRCGSASLHVPKEPRAVELRLRYHRDGELALVADTVYNVVGLGPAHSHRSLLVYGVFDEANRAVQWRARHQFPTIRNEEAQRLGLRRRFRVERQRYGPGPAAVASNPYGYGEACGGDLVDFDEPPLETEARAVFNTGDLPPAASTAAALCARATVHDPTGPFATVALARKNPEVRPAFPVLRSPIRDATPIQYLLTVCTREISAEHLAMQRQRLLLGDLAPLCIDGWDAARVQRELTVRLKADIERVRAGGKDMVLALALHHDSTTLGPAVEAALAEVLAPERDRSTPRVAGAFLLDSYAYTVADSVVGQTALWCPAQQPKLGDEGEGEGEGEGELPDAGSWWGWDRLDLGIPSWAERPAAPAGPGPGPGGRDAGAPGDPGLDAGDTDGATDSPSTASLACAILPDLPQLVLGPFSVGLLPILPTRQMYLDFIADYSEAQAGRVRSLAYRVPELPPSAAHVAVPPWGVATFFNDELITASADDAFSFCRTDEYGGFVFRSRSTPELMPIESLPDWHAAAREGSYELGIVWDFPFLLRMDYEAVVAASVSAFSLSVPFGIGTSASEDYGSSLWTEEEIPMARSLTQCRRYCDHPTFDAGGVYQVEDRFRDAYRGSCYAPRYPQRGDSGFPHDP